ncbi:hypothetical protein MTO96_042356 [Rhipicephalus appendiculatus]
MTTESEVAGSCFAADKESTPSQDTDGFSSRKKKKRRSSSAQRRHKASRHRRGQSTDTAASRCSSGSPTTTPSTDLGGVPSLDASGPGGAASQGHTVHRPENAASLGAPLTSQRDGGVEEADQHVGFEGAFMPCVGALPQKFEPSTTKDIAVVESAQQDTVVANSSVLASNSTASQLSQALAEASAGNHLGQPPINFIGDGASQAALPGTSVAPHQLHPCRGSDALAAEDAAEDAATASALPRFESTHPVVESPPKVSNEDVAGHRELSRRGACARRSGDRRRYRDTRIPGPSADVSTTDKHEPLEGPLANKPASPSELKRRARVLQHSFAEMVASGTSAGGHQLLVVAAVSATASLLFLIVTGLVILLLMHASSTGGDANSSDPCLGLSDCYQHMALIASRVNRSIDPCQDFSAHVCSAWSAPEFREFASTQDDVALSWARQFRDILDAGTGVLAVSAFEATRHTPSIQAEQWLSKVNENFDVAPAVTDTDLLMTANGVFLKTVDSVFAHYDQRELLAYLAWFLVQVLAPAADPSLLVVRYGSEERAGAHRPLFCAAHVEAVFRVLIISLYAIPRFSATLRNNVDTLLRGIRHTAAERLNALSWLDDASKIHGRVKLDWMNTTLWPAPDMLEESGLVPRIPELLLVERVDLFRSLGGEPPCP